MVAYGREPRGYGTSMAVVWAVGQFSSYLWARPFTLVTDCPALTWLFRSQDLSPKLHRWALRLMEYDMTLHWRAGAPHHLPDAPPRLPRPEKLGEDVGDSCPDEVSR